MSMPGAGSPARLAGATLGLGLALLSAARCADGPRGRPRERSEA